MYKLKDKQDQLDDNIQKILSKCYQQISCDYPGVSIILYGSQARNQAGEFSDIDIIVLLEGQVSEKTRKDIHDRIYEIGLEEDVVISAFIKSRQSWQSPISQASPLYKSVQNEGILIG
jgi:predicted nucleotidyltransferase